MIEGIIPGILFNYTRIIPFLKNHHFGKCSHLIFLIQYFIETSRLLIPKSGGRDPNPQDWGLWLYFILETNTIQSPFNFSNGRSCLVLLLHLSQIHDVFPLPGNKFYACPSIFPLLLQQKSRLWQILIPLSILIYPLPSVAIWMKQSFNSRPGREWLQ